MLPHRELFTCGFKTLGAIVPKNKEIINKKHTEPEKNRDPKSKFQLKASKTRISKACWTNVKCCSLVGESEQERSGRGSVTLLLGPTQDPALSRSMSNQIVLTTADSSRKDTTWKWSPSTVRLRLTLLARSLTRSQGYLCLSGAATVQLQSL